MDYQLFVSLVQFQFNSWIFFFSKDHLGILKFNYESKEKKKQKDSIAMKQEARVGSKFRLGDSS